MVGSHRRPRHLRTFPRWTKRRDLDTLTNRGRITKSRRQHHVTGMPKMSAPNLVVDGEDSRDFYLIPFLLEATTDTFLRL
jgi:hypothetical protein